MGLLNFYILTISQGKSLLLLFVSIDSIPSIRHATMVLMTMLNDNTTSFHFQNHTSQFCKNRDLFRYILIFSTIVLFFSLKKRIEYYVNTKDKQNYRNFWFNKDISRVQIHPNVFENADIIEGKCWHDRIKRGREF